MEYPMMVAQQRERLGKGGARALRRTGKIPGICYAGGTPPLHLTLDPDELSKVIRTEMGANSVIRLSFEGSASPEQMVMLKDIQRHPVSRKPIHADLIQVDMSKKLRVWIPVVLTGRAKGVVLGGILQIIRRQLEVECLPKDIPAKIEIDVTQLNLGDAVHIGDLQLPEGVRATEDTRYTIATVVAPTGETEAGAAEETSTTA